MHCMSCQVKQYRVEQGRILNILTPFEVKRIEKKKQSEVNREDYDYFMDDSRNIWKEYKVPQSIAYRCHVWLVND